MHSFIDDHFDEIRQIADGQKYDLTFTLKCDDGNQEQIDFIKSVRFS